MDKINWRIVLLILFMISVFSVVFIVKFYDKLYERLPKPQSAVTSTQTEPRSAGAAANPSADPAVIKAGACKIGVSFSDARNGRMELEMEAMDKEATRQGAALYIRNAENDSDRQVTQCKQLIERKVDVLIIIPVNGTSAAKAAEEAAKEGIKVIIFDDANINTVADLYIAFNQERISQLQEQYVTLHAPKGNYVILSAASSDTDVNRAVFRQGDMLETLAGKGQINIVMNQTLANCQPENVQRLLENALFTTENKLDAILAYNDDIAAACAQKLAEKDNIQLPVITGRDAKPDAIRRILEGTQSMTVLCDKRELCRVAIEYAVKMSKGDKIDTVQIPIDGGKTISAILMEPQMVDKNNVDRLIFDSGYYRKADIMRDVSKP